MKETCRQYLQKCRKILVDLTSFQLDVYSSGAAFFIFISIIPFFLIILFIIPYISLTQSEVIAASERMIPEDFQAAAFALIRELYVRSNAILPMSIIALLWSASRGIMAITKGLNRIRGIEENRNYFIVRLIAMIYTVLLVAGVLLLIFLGVFGKRIFRLIDQYFEALRPVAAVIMQYSDITMVVVLFLLFLFMYKFLPAGRMRLKRQIPGAILATFVWWGFTKLFSDYILYYNAYSMYGSLAMVIIFMVWIYAGIYFFFIGAWMNQRLEEKKGV